MKTTKKERYEQKIENLEWAVKVLPFLSDPDKVQDDDFSLIAIVANCTEGNDCTKE